MVALFAIFLPKDPLEHILRHILEICFSKWANTDKQGD